MTPDCVSRMMNSSSSPGSPLSLATTTQSTSPNWFVRAVPQISRAPVGRPLASVLESISRYAVMLVQWTSSPIPWSMYSRCPQVGEPCLHPPPTPKFAFAPLSRTMNPPPVRKSHCHAFAEPLARSEEHTSELQSRLHLVCRLLLEK